MNGPTLVPEVSTERRSSIAADGGGELCGGCGEDGGVAVTRCGQPPTSDEGLKRHKRVQIAGDTAAGRGHPWTTAPLPSCLSPCLLFSLSRRPTSSSTRVKATQGGRGSRGPLSSHGLLAEQVADRGHVGAAASERLRGRPLLGNRCKWRGWPLLCSGGCPPRALRVCARPPLPPLPLPQPASASLPTLVGDKSPLRPSSSPRPHAATMRSNRRRPRGTSSCSKNSGVRCRG
jgi:hypothetical protein